MSELIEKIKEVITIARKEGLTEKEEWIGNTRIIVKGVSFLKNLIIRDRNVVIKSERVGTIHLLTKEGKWLVKMGDKVKKGDIIGEIDVLRTEHEVYSPCSGTVCKILVSHKSIVQYGTELLVIDVSESKEA